MLRWPQRRGDISVPRGEGKQFPTFRPLRHSLEVLPLPELRKAASCRPLPDGQHLEGCLTSKNWLVDPFAFCSVGRRGKTMALSQYAGAGAVHLPVYPGRVLSGLLQPSEAREAGVGGDQFLLGPRRPVLVSHRVTGRLALSG
jgi:hypothetical protein